jgi:hypothetical protein
VKQLIDELAGSSELKKNPNPSLLLGIGFGLGILVALGIAWTVGGARRPLAEGVIWSVEWTTGDGKPHGLTRTDNARAVPGGNGSWNMNLEGKLYPTHLEITFPDSKEVGPQIIPLSRLVNVTFGDGGVPRKTVAHR